MSPAETKKSHAGLMAAAEPLRGTPYELAYVSQPGDGSTRYVFQHTVALGIREAWIVILRAKHHLHEGTAEWSDGKPYKGNHEEDGNDDNK